MWRSAAARTPALASRRFSPLSWRNSAPGSWARIHVPVTSNPGVSFHPNGAPVTMAPGEAWYLRLSDPRRAANQGGGDRVHLVIDAIVDEWMAAQLATGAASC